jgi:hypothetical protein
MLRIPLLENRDFPRGRIQPYAALGIGIFFYDISVAFRPDAFKHLKTAERNRILTSIVPAIMAFSEDF